MRNLKIWSLIAVLAMMFLGYSCSEDDDVVLSDVTVQLVYPNGFAVKEGVNVKARSASGLEFEMKTNTDGMAMLRLPIGAYEFSASDISIVNKKFTAFNALKSEIIEKSTTISLKMVGSTKSQLVIKEAYFGGCPKDDGAKRAYSFDSYIKLYNNSPEPVDLENLCFGSLISNSHAMKMMKEVEEGDTEPYWFKKDWTPAAMGYFYFPNKTILEPFKTITVVVNGAINHTEVHSQSVDLSGAENYTMFDIDVFNNKYRYPSPSANIPTTHYLKAVKYGLGNAWGTTTACPNLFLFYPEGQTPEDYGNDRTDDDFWMKNDRFPRKKVPTKWTVDGLDAFTAGKEDDNVKRINPKVDAGHIYFVSGKGYTLYRNVDKDLTEAIEGNKAKLVYNYAMGTKDVEPKYGTTDPSGIDAEASIANGAVIIYKDTNNSGNDFHMRKQSSLRK